MVGVEIDFVVTDSLKAMELYERIFEVQRVEITAYERGLNEAVFTMYGTHMLDAEYQLIAPKESDHWMLHQIYREVSFEERCRIMEVQERGEK